MCLTDVILVSQNSYDTAYSETGTF